MIKRVFWMSIGVTIGVIAVRRLSDAKNTLGPAGLNKAVGTAAALGIKAGQKNTREVDLALLRKTLSEQGAIVPGLDKPGKFDL